MGSFCSRRPDRRTQQDTTMTTTDIEKAVDEAFCEHETEIGDYWSSTYAIQERDALAFVLSVFAKLNIEIPQQ